MSQDEKQPEPINIKGVVKASGDRIKFVDSEGGKPRDVVDPEALKEHVGHHAERSAHLYKEKGQIHLMSVTMPKE
jgi:hypothetical protein